MPLSRDAESKVRVCIWGSMRKERFDAESEVRFCIWGSMRKVRFAAGS